MAQFTQLDSDGIVINLIVVADSDAPNEAAGIAFCQELLGADGNWLQSSYNNNIRAWHAGIGMKYDSTSNVFYQQQPYPSWTLDTTLWTWEPPVAMPDDAGNNSEDPPTEFVSYDWDENSTSWTNRTVLTPA